MILNKDLISFFGGAGFNGLDKDKYKRFSNFFLGLIFINKNYNIIKEGLNC